MPPTYLISKVGDPIFAFAIGAAAALVRIRRDEKSKYPHDQVERIGYGALWETGSRRLSRWWNGEFQRR